MKSNFSHAKLKLQKYPEHLAALLVSSNINQCSVISEEFTSVDKIDDLQRKFKFMPACEQEMGSISYELIETANCNYVFLIISRQADLIPHSAVSQTSSSHVFICRS